MLPATVLSYPVAQDAVGQLGVADLLLGVFLTAGAALLPDADHPNGTIAHTLGPITHSACTLISRISGGHRGATHSFAFVVAAFYGTWAGQHWLGRWFTLGLVFFLLSLAVRALHLCPPGNSFKAWGPIVVMSSAGTFAIDQWIDGNPAWLPFAVGLGALAHVLGDCLTDRGCRLFWPIGIRISFPIIDRTGNKVETWIMSPMFTLGALAFLWYTITQS